MISAWAMIHAMRAWEGERHWQRARPLARALSRTDWKASDAEFAALLDAAGRAVAAEPDNAYYRYWTAVYRWRWLRMQADEPTASLPVNDRTVAAAQRIVGELNEARTRAPTFGLVYTILGQIELNFLKRPIGYDHVQAGHLLSRNDGYAAYIAGEADARRGQFDTAAKKFHEAILIDRTMIDDVVDCYVSDVERPDLAADGVGDDFMALLKVRDALRKQPKWKDLSDKVEARAYTVLEAECKSPDARPWKFASLGAYQRDHGRNEESERNMARALQGEPTNVYWRCHRAETLYKLGRTREAIEEARLALQQHPDAPEAKAAIKLVTGGAAGNRPG
jgi:tetratricopeptide (TPR) repeat protein